MAGVIMPLAGHGWVMGTARFMGLLACILLLMILALAAFELLVHLFLGERSSVATHVMNVIASSVIAAAIAFHPLHRVRLLLRQSLEEVEMRKRTEDALQKERDKLITILESMEDGVYIVWQSHDIEYINPVIEREFGPVNGRKCYDYFHGLSGPCPWCKNEDVFKGRTVRWVWYSAKARKTYDLFDTPLRMADGQIAKLEIFRDITELKRIEEALRFDEKRFEALYQLSQMVDAPLRCISDFVLDQGVQLTMSKLGFIGYMDEKETTFTIHSWSDAGVKECNIRDKTFHFRIAEAGIWAESVRRREPVVVNDYTAANPDKRGYPEGHVTITRFLSVPVFESDRIVAVAAVANKEEEYNASDVRQMTLLMDGMWKIVQTKLAEQALKSSEQMYRKLYQEFSALLNAIPDTLILLSPQLEILWANHGAAYRVNGTVSDMTGQRCYEALQKGPKPCEECPALKSFRSGKLEQFVMNRGSRFVDLRAFPIIEQGRVDKVIVVGTDITEKINLQAEAVQAAHLASLGELAAGVAHEINNPINGVINYAQIMVNKSDPGQREHDIGNRILKESDRVANIVRSLLSFARGSQEDMRPIQLHGILAESLILIQSQMRKDGIQLNMSVPSDLPETVGSCHQIQQVVLNIINNARYALNQKYSGRSEEKILDIMGEELRENSCRYVRLSFHDRGCGIPASILGHVTNPFFSTKPSGQGTGLGLSISQRIVKEHGGRLAIESVEGSYTRVVVDLPARTDDE